MNENERIVCEFLRKIAPPREWEYLGEVEHYWISQLCDELNKQLKTENAKLREELAKWERLAAGIDLPEYPVTQFIPKDLERENSKLRELVADMLVCVSEGDWDCSDCPRYARCDEGVSEFIDRARELGVGADV